jgi:hypothetical protein
LKVLGNILTDIPYYRWESAPKISSNLIHPPAAPLPKPSLNNLTGTAARTQHALEAFVRRHPF